MNKPWLTQYPSTIAANVDVKPFPSLVHLLNTALKKHAGRAAITSLGKTTTFAELDLMATRFAAWLQAQGIQKGDRVAVMMPNLMPVAVAILGTLRAGAVVVTVNPLYTSRELAHQLNDSGAKVLVVFEAFTATAAPVLAESAVQKVVVVGTGMAGMQPVAIDGQVGFLQTLQVGALVPAARAEVTGDDLAFLQYTGGTTGVSKGAMLSHANVMANLMQISEWMRPALADDEITGKNVASFLPLYHIFALTYCLLFGLKNGLHNLFVANPRDMKSAAIELGGQPIHILPGVNTLFAGLANNPPLLQVINLRQLRLAIGGGTAVQQGIAERWIEATGVPICEGYGLSETSPVATCNLVTQRSWTGSAGLPLPNTEVVIRDDANHGVATDERGEICIRGPQVMQGYWGREQETAQAMTADGFFKTGDIGVMDQNGYLKIVDRKKDMILVSGFNVFPAEIEDVVSTLVGVLESAAVGVSDDKSGEAVKLFVVRSNDQTVSEEQVRQHCRTHLTSYKNPKLIEFVLALPKSNVGKVLRRELRVG